MLSLFHFLNFIVQSDKVDNMAYITYNVVGGNQDDRF